MFAQKPSTWSMSALAVAVSVVVLGSRTAYPSENMANEATQGPTHALAFKTFMAAVSGSPTGTALEVLADSLVAASTSTTALNVTVESDGSGAITVRPGSEIRYQVVGLLSDHANEGLALVGFDLVFDGGDLTQADSPTGVPTPGCDNPMINFTIPWGITNPAGYGGTVIDGDLIQVGGGQNTMNNTPDIAPFPIGPVLTGVAQPGGCGPAILVTGTLTAPEVEGIYTLAATGLFANVIREGETGEPFWATEAAGVGRITPLTIIVSNGTVAAGLDIKPRLCPNPVNVSSRGVVPMAVVGNAAMSVTEIDPDSLVLTRADGVGGSVEPIVSRLGRIGVVEDVAAPFDGAPCDCQDAAGDGLDDFVVRFATREMADVLALGSLPRGTQVSLTLRGSLADGTVFEASDCVVTTGRHRATVRKAAGKPPR